MEIRDEGECDKRACCLFLSRLVRALEDRLERKGTYITAAVLLPLAFFPLLVMVVALDLSSASPSGEWTSIFSGLSLLAPSGDYAAVRDMGAPGWLLIAGMVSMAVLLPVWAAAQVARNFRDPTRHGSQ